MNIKKYFPVTRIVGLCLLAAMLLLLNIGPAFADSSDGHMVYVRDSADVLTYDEWQYLEKRAENLYAEYGIPAYIIIVDDYKEYASGDIWDVADYIWDELELGLPGNYSQNDGFMLLLSMSERDYDNGSYGNGQNILTNYGKIQIETSMLNEFGKNNWYEGCDAYFDGIKFCIKKYNEGTPIDGDIETHPKKPLGTGDKIMIAAASLGVPGVACGYGVSKMKSVKKKSNAQDYVSNVELQKKSDAFSHTTTSVRTIENNNSSRSTRSSGSFHSSGSSSHHSGKF